MSNPIKVLVNILANTSTKNAVLIQCPTQLNAGGTAQNFCDAGIMNHVTVME